MRVPVPAHEPGSVQGNSKPGAHSFSGLLPFGRLCCFWSSSPSSGWSGPSLTVLIDAVRRSRQLGQSCNSDDWIGCWPLNNKQNQLKRNRNQIWIVSLENDQSVDDAGDCAPKRNIPYSSFSSKGLWIFLPPSGKYDKVIHFCLFYVHVFLVTLPLHPATWHIFNVPKERRVTCRVTEGPLLLTKGKVIQEHDIYAFFCIALSFFFRF